MVKKFKYGFEYKGMNYGWSNKELYRLPTVTDSGRSYGLKKLTLIDVGKQKGYNVGRDKKSLKVLEGMTEKIDYVYSVPTDDDLPW